MKNRVLFAAAILVALSTAFYAHRSYSTDTATPQDTNHSLAAVDACGDFTKYIGLQPEEV